MVCASVDSLLRDEEQIDVVGGKFLTIAFDSRHNSTVDIPGEQLFKVSTTFSDCSSVLSCVRNLMRLSTSGFRYVNSRSTGSFGLRAIYTGDNIDNGTWDINGETVAVVESMSGSLEGNPISNLAILFVEFCTIVNHKGAWRRTDVPVSLGDPLNEPLSSCFFPCPSVSSLSSRLFLCLRFLLLHLSRHQSPEARTSTATPVPTPHPITDSLDAELWPGVCMNAAAVILVPRDEGVAP
jgi:hypothetical protein